MQETDLPFLWTAALALTNLARPVTYILLPWQKKLRQPRKPNIGACMLERSCACATCARVVSLFLARVVALMSKYGSKASQSASHWTCKLWRHSLRTLYVNRYKLVLNIRTSLWMTLAGENEDILFTNTRKSKTISTTFRLKASSGREATSLYALQCCPGCDVITCKPDELPFTAAFIAILRMAGEIQTTLKNLHGVWREKFKNTYLWLMSLHIVLCQKKQEWRTGNLTANKWSQLFCLLLIVRIFSKWLLSSWAIFGNSTAL